MNHSENFPRYLTKIAARVRPLIGEATYIGRADFLYWEEEADEAPRPRFYHQASSSYKGGTVAMTVKPTQEKRQAATGLAWWR